MKKVVDVILDKAFDGFCEKASSLDNSLNLNEDLKLNSDSIRLIVSRVEIILDTYIDQRLFKNVNTISDFRKVVHQTYSEKFN